MQIFLIKNNSFSINDYYRKNGLGRSIGDFSFVVHFPQFILRIMSPEGISHSVIVIRLSPIPVCGGRFQQGHRSLGSAFRQLLMDNRTFAIYIKVFYYNKLTYQIRKPDHPARHRPAAQGAGHQVQHQPRNDPPPFLPASVCHQFPVQEQ